MKLILLLTVLPFLMCCSKSKNVSKSDPYFKDKIGAKLCTKSNTFLSRWTENSVDFFEYQEYVLNIPEQTSRIDQTLSEYKDVAPFAKDKSKISEINLLKVGTKLQIKDVYFFKTSWGSGYLVMALVDGSTKNGKLVNIARFYEINEPYALKEKYAEYCQ